MQSRTAFTYWQDNGMWLGYLDEFPDYTTQGTSLEDLKEHLLDIHKEIISKNIPIPPRQHATLEVV
jgi:predicted RNase H-like HicB family nuclease